MSRSTQSWFPVLDCLLAMFVSIAAQSSGCSFHEDIHGRVQPVSPLVLVGSTVILNCTIHPDVDGITARGVFWRHNTETIPAEGYRVLSDTVSQLVIENVSSDSAGRYECFVPEPTNRDCGSLVGGAELEVGYAPEQPVLDSCVSDNLALFSCSWYKGRETLIQTKYSITYTNYDGHEDQVCPRLIQESASLSCDFGPGTSHVGNVHFRLNVTAENQLGRAESVIVVNPVNYVKPAPVRSLDVIGQGSTSVSLSWSNPEGLSHLPRVLGLLYQARYRSEWDPDTVQYVNLSQTTQGELTDLNPFTTYEICVRAHPVQLDSSSGDVIGTDGYWSDCPRQEVSVRTHKAAPVGTVPAWLHVTPSRDPGVRNVVVYWKELPLRNQNGDIKNYRVSVTSRLEHGQISQVSYRTTVPDNKRHLNLSENVFKVKGSRSEMQLQLKSDTSYVIKIYASNELGSSPDTSLLLPQDGEVPTVPSTIQVNVTSPTSVMLSWQQPAESRVQLTGYIVFWMAWKSENRLYTWGQPDWERVADDQTLPKRIVQHEVSRGLEGRTRYRFGIVMVSSEGFGEAKLVDVYTEEMAPVGQVEDVSLTPAGRTSLQLTWEPLRLEWRRGILQGYQVQYCPLAAGTICAEGTTNTVNVTGEETASLLLQGLSPFTKYSATIAAVNREGLGPFTDASVQTTAEAAPEDPPTNITFSQVTARVLQLTWDLPTTPNGIIAYYMAEVNGEVHQLGDVNTVPVYGNTSYAVRLQACTSAGCGPFSPSHSVTTPIGAPEAPPPPTVSERRSSPSTVHLQLATPAHPNGLIDHYLVSYALKDSKDRTQPHVQRVEGASEAVLEVDCAGNKAVMYEFWVQAVNRDEEGELLIGEPSERLERQMCLVPVMRVDGVPVAIVIPVVAGIISIILVSFLVWKNRHRVKRKLFPKVPGPVLFLEEDGPYSALYVVTATNKHEPEICDDISDFLGKDGEVSLLTGDQDSLNKKEDTNEARRSAPKTPLGSMSYVSRQEDSSPPSGNGISQTPQPHSPTDSVDMMSLWDAEKTPCHQGDTIRVVPEGDEDCYCVTGALLDKTPPECNASYVTNLPSPTPNYVTVDTKQDVDFYCVTGTLRDSTSPGPTKQQVSPPSDMPYITKVPSTPPSGSSRDSKPDREEHFGYQARQSVESLCEEKQPLVSNQEGGEGHCFGDQGHCPDGHKILKVDHDGYVKQSLPDGTYVTDMPDNVSPTFGPYTPH
ncbi:protein sidekick-2-like isoform X1 [Branchiostoma lanceolatum]|uniref:protein sidekick-2-like isoform X1 n=1 Tax=Branchiostoma lanceolatum TaxID=7740 RepID=UPI003455C525